MREVFFFFALSFFYIKSVIPLIISVAKKSSSIPYMQWNNPLNRNFEALLQDIDALPSINHAPMSLVEGKSFHEIDHSLTQRILKIVFLFARILIRKGVLKWVLWSCWPISNVLALQRRGLHAHVLLWSLMQLWIAFIYGYNPWMASFQWSSFSVLVYINVNSDPLREIFMNNDA